MDNIVAGFQFAHCSFVTVELNDGRNDSKYRASENDHNMVGYGNTIDDAIQSLANSFRRVAESIEKAAKERHK